ncbi:MAG: phenylacetic acid degradation operon negative regulatory protein PaaX [Proteobacteria bacterium]|nr:phenylacetic acid degradation operon negative regulatory protein PaaX [Pseudomonadota bacterium]
MSVSSTTKAIVDEFRSRPTLRAGSLITTVFGDAIAPRGGNVWVGSLINVMADFGINERLVRTSVFRLSKDGLLDVRQVGRRSFYGLTAQGARMFERATQRIYGEPRRDWSGNWCIILLAALSTEAREIVRKELRWLGFGAIGGSVLAHPSPDVVSLKEVCKRLQVADDIVVLQSACEDDAQDQALRSLAQKSWNLDDIDQRYAGFVQRFRPVYAAVRKARTLESRLAFQIRTLLIQEYRKILLRDPLLPAGLLPSAWHGNAAYALCRNLYLAVYADADKLLSDCMETAEGPLPPPSPSFYGRFGGLRERSNG